MAMPDPRNVENWVEAYLRPRYPELVEDHRRAVEAYKAAVRAEILDEDALTILTTQAQHRSSVLRDESSEMISRHADVFASTATTEPPCGSLAAKATAPCHPPFRPAKTG